MEFDRHRIAPGVVKWSDWRLKKQGVFSIKVKDAFEEGGREGGGEVVERGFVNSPRRICLMNGELGQLNLTNTLEGQATNS